MDIPGSCLNSIAILNNESYGVSDPYCLRPYFRHQQCSWFLLAKFIVTNFSLILKSQKVIINWGSLSFARNCMWFIINQLSKRDLKLCSKTPWKEIYHSSRISLPSRHMKGRTGAIREWELLCCLPKSVILGIFELDTREQLKFTCSSGPQESLLKLHCSSKMAGGGWGKK